MWDEATFWGGFVGVYVLIGALPAIVSQARAGNRVSPANGRFVVIWTAGLILLVVLQSQEAPAWLGFVAAVSAFSVALAVTFRPTWFTRPLRGLLANLGASGRHWGQWSCFALGGVALATAALFSDFVDNPLVLAVVGATLLFAGLALRAMSVLGRNR